MAAHEVKLSEIQCRRTESDMACNNLMIIAPKNVGTTGKSHLRLSVMVPN